MWPLSFCLCLLHIKSIRLDDESVLDEITLANLESTAAVSIAAVQQAMILGMWYVSIAAVQQAMLLGIMCYSLNVDILSYLRIFLKHSFVFTIAQAVLVVERPLKKTPMCAGWKINSDSWLNNPIAMKL